MKPKLNEFYEKYLSAFEKKRKRLKQILAIYVHV